MNVFYFFTLFTSITIIVFVIFFLLFFYNFFFSIKWDINRRHSFTTRRVSSMALTSNLASKVIFGLLMAVRQFDDLAVARLTPPNIISPASSYYSAACSIFLEHLIDEGRRNNGIDKQNNNNVGRK